MNENDVPATDASGLVAAAPVLNLPPFTSTDAAPWFQRVEALFRLRAITSASRKADYVIGALPAEVFSQVSDWLVSQGTDTILYNDLKQQIILRCSPTPEERAKKIMDLLRLPLGDQRPSSAFREMKALSTILQPDGSTAPLDLVRVLWLLRLPQDIRSTITDFASRSEADLIKQADSLVGASTLATTSSAAAATLPEDDEDDPYAMAAQQRRPRNGSQRPPPVGSSRSLCYFHKRFGRDARNCRPPMLLFKKRVGRLPDHNPVAACSTCHFRCPQPCVWTEELVGMLPHPVAACPSTTTFTLQDPETKIEYLIDTGASRSLIPRSLVRGHQRKSSLVMQAANGSSITTYGNKEYPLNYDSKRYSWKFLIADVFMPIIGADFLYYFSLAVDVRNRRLIPTGRPVLKYGAPTSQSSAAAASDPFEALFSEFADVFNTALPSLAKKPHDIQHHIITKGPPVYAKFRRLSPAKLEAAKKVFRELESQGICQKASSPWSSPLHMVLKKDGTYRPCGDYRRLNNITEGDHYPLPNINDITSFLDGAKVFSKLDLTKGYYQIPMAPKDIPKTAVTTPFGTFTFNYSCFGLRNAGATFQRTMDVILGNLPFCTVYIDDILVFSKTVEEHLQHLRIILQRLREYGLILHPQKCSLAKAEMEFLGHSLSSEGVTPTKDKVAAITRFPTPKTIKSLQEFVGMITYYHRFLPGIAKILAPLHNALSGKKKKLMWSAALQTAFEDAKRAIAKAVLLSFPAKDAQLQLLTDASDHAIGAALQQLTPKGPAPIAFFSRKLSPAEQRYSTFDRELLAVYAAVRHFRHFLEAVPFDVFTDHMPLIDAVSKKSDPISKRQQRHLSAITEFDCRLRHVSGKFNPVADALSRNCSALTVCGLDLRALADEQQKCPPPPLPQHSTLTLEKIEIPEGPTILCDTSTGTPRPWVPPSFRKAVFDIIHGLSHPSRKTTVKLLKQKYIWDSIASDVKTWATACIPCQKAKIVRHTETGFGKFTQPNRRFGHIHVDIVGPLPTSQGYRYLFTTIDRSTRWPEAVPMVDASTDSCVSALIDAWISRFGLPENITSDRGSVFTSALWTQLAQRLGISTTTTTAYNPEANGIVERLHRTLKAALMSRCTSDKWKTELPWVLLGLRTTPKDADDHAPAEKVYGDNLTVPADFFRQSPDLPLAELRDAVTRFIPCQQTYSTSRTTYVPADLNSSSHVFMRIDAAKPPLTPPYIGPYKVLQRRKKSFQLQIRNSTDWVSIDRLKPAYLLDNDQPPVTFSRAGRPLRGRQLSQGGSAVAATDE